MYQLDVTPEVFAAQLPMYGDEDQCRHHFSSVVLVEAVAETRGGTVDLDSVTQTNTTYQGVGSQAPWDEGLLSPDGESVLARTMNCVKGEGAVRFAFYMHFWDSRRPLTWKQGDIQCPQPEPMPDRLKKLMPYRPCD